MEWINCSTCVHSNLSETHEPCARCKGTAPYGSKEYENRPRLWSESNPLNDPVNHPSHYNKGKIEVWDFISDWKLNFDRGNAIKYICRAGSKDPNKEIQDLEKAIEYINHEIKMLKGDVVNVTEET